MQYSVEKKKRFEMTLFEKVEQEALRLSQEEKEVLVQSLLEDLGENSAVMEPEIEKAWE